MPRPYSWLVTALVLCTACGGGGGGGGEPDSAGAVLQVVQPAPPAKEPAGVADPPAAQVAAAAIHYQGTRDGRRTVIGRDGQAISETTVSEALVTASGIFDFITAPFDLFSNIFGGGGGGSHGPTLADYFPAGDDDRWTFLDDAEILQGADPVLLFPSDPPPPPTDRFSWGFTLLATKEGLSFADQEVAGGTITAPPGRPLLWLTNDLRPGRDHQTAGDLTFTPTDGSEPRTVHVSRSLKLIGTGPHTTAYSYFDDVLHFQIIDTVTPGAAYPITSTDDDESCNFVGQDDSCQITYDIYLARAFGPVECTATDGITPRQTEIESAFIGGRDLPDTDDDGVVDAHDNCPRVANPDQANHDDDGSGDVCDNDDDGDGLADALDHCPMGDTGWISTAITDHDGDGCADATEDGDDDNDGVLDAADRCATGATGWTSDPTTDHDGDGCADAAEDGDDDNDGVLDAADRCATGQTGWTSDPTTDHDADGCADAGEDNDDDNDGVPDYLDFAPLDDTVSEGPYRVYLWATNGAVRHLYAIDPDSGATTEVSPPNPDEPGELWGVAVYPKRPDATSEDRVAFLAPKFGKAPTDPEGSHLWVDGAPEPRDLTSDADRPIVGVTAWRTDGEAIYFLGCTSGTDPGVVLYQVNRDGSGPATPYLTGRVWRPTFSYNQRFLAYANQVEVSLSPPTGLLLRDCDSDRVRNITPDAGTGGQMFYLDREPEFSFDGRRLAIAGSGRTAGCTGTGAPTEKIEVRDTESGGVVQRLTPASFGVGNLAYQLPPGFEALSPDGNWLAVEVYSGSSGHLAVVDLTSGDVASIAPALPPPGSQTERWQQRAGGWTFSDPPALILPLPRADGTVCPTRLPVDGSESVVLAAQSADGPILLSPYTQTVFFVARDTVWRVAADGTGTPTPLAQLAGSTDLRLEVAQ